MSFESKSVYNLPSMESIIAHSDSEETADSSSMESIINDEDITFHQYGYTKIKQLTYTLQGELYKAIKHDTQQYVAIKKTSKYLQSEQIAFENGSYFCVSENIVKESLIMKHLTVNNQPIGDYIVKFIDFFHSATDYYLVMEFINSEMNLKQFICQAQNHINNNKLSIQEYNKMIKYLLWQLFVTFYWLHNCMHCCHLDVCGENIMLQNASFIESKTGDMVHINPQISIKLTDFGVSELFMNSDQATNMFDCEKQGLSIYNEGYFAPNVFNGYVYNAQCSDNWSLGMLMFQCLTIGKQLYSPLNMYKPTSGYCALLNNKLAHYLSANNMLQYFNVNSFKLLNSLLNINEEKRLKGIDILRNKWFKLYFKRYKKQIEKKIHNQKQKLIHPQHILEIFPFYC